MPLQGQVAIVTGASKGIGRAIAGRLASEGAQVVLSSRTQAPLEEAAAEISRQGLKAIPLVTDVSSEEQVNQLVKSTVQKFGRIDILVNNAGFGIFKSAAELTVDEFDSMWRVNMRGVFLATKAVLPHMSAAKSGDIVNICSLAGKNGFKGGTGYGATKWALRGFATSLMLEVRENNIRVITVFPGSVETGFSTTGKRGENITQPEDVADAVFFAVSAPRRSMFSEIDVRPTNPR